MLRKVFNFIDSSLTSAHHQWYHFLNWYQKYNVQPFSARYWWTRQKLVTETCNLTLATPENWHDYINQPHLRFYDERIVEYSWAINRISKLSKKSRFLDVGCVMNTKYCLEKLLKQFADIYFLNLVSEPLAMHGRISFHTQDVRKCDLPKHSFDCITCISTLEHVGGDNSYNNFSVNGTAEINSSSHHDKIYWQDAFVSLFELLSPDGLLLVSMPYGGGLWENGEYKLGENDIKSFYEIASRYNRELIITVIKKNENGWHKIDDLSMCEDVKYSDWKPAGANIVVLVETISHDVKDSPAY